MMPTLDAMPADHFSIAKEMSDAAREAMRAAGWPPLNDDRAARFDEACAVYLQQTINHRTALCTTEPQQ